MVLQNVTQRSSFFIEWSAAFNADTLGRRDLNVIDIVAVPDRLKDSVRKAKDQDVLHRLFAKVMVDAEDLVLIKYLVHIIIQLSGRFQIVPERLLDDDPCMALLGMRHALRAKPVDDVGKILRSHGKVKQPVALRSTFFVDLFEESLQVSVATVIVKVHRMVNHLLDERVNFFVAFFAATEFQDPVFHVPSERALQITTRHADNGKLRG